MVEGLKEEIEERNKDNKELSDIVTEKNNEVTKIPIEYL